jgi:hypothetical protein
LSLAAVRDLRERRELASPEELAAFETDVLAGFVLARASAGLSDGTINSDVNHIEQARAWFGRPLWEMEPPDADVYFGKATAGRCRPNERPAARAGEFLRRLPVLGNALFPRTVFCLLFARS